jgi:GNAT superfamily N-acetyltransferase
VNQESAIKLSLNPSADEVWQLRSRLIEYNRSHEPAVNYLPFLLSLNDDAGEMVAGLYAQMYYSWMFVELLWVAEHSRGHGLGSKLLAQAEEQAREHGCHSVWLDTFSFQARGFYERCGYTLFGDLPDYPEPHRRYFFSKRLS